MIFENPVSSQASAGREFKLAGILRYIDRFPRTVCGLMSLLNRRAFVDRLVRAPSSPPLSAAR